MIETQIDLTIRQYDIDMAGIVSNIVYVRWLEDLREELLRQHALTRVLFERNLVLVLVRTEIDYRAPLRFLDHCRGRMRVAEIGRASVAMLADFCNREGLLVSEAKQVGVLVDSLTGKPTVLPDEVRAIFEGKGSVLIQQPQA